MMESQGYCSCETFVVGDSFNDRADKLSVGDRLRKQQFPENVLAITTIDIKTVLLSLKLAVIATSYGSMQQSKTCMSL